jgi:TM2 domain-containing membrane protein YozV
MFCNRCGSDVDDSRYCPNCGSPQEALVPATSQPGAASSRQIVFVQSTRNPGVAAVLSFFVPGLGQVYNGQIGKGIALMVVYAVSLALIAALVGIVTTPILCIWSMFGARNTATRLNASNSRGF